MELNNRRLLLLNDDIPASTVSPIPFIQTNDTESTTTNNSYSQPPLRLPPRPVLDANVAYTMLVLLTALFFLGFVAIYIRRFGEDSAVLVSSQRRRRRNYPSSPSSWNHYSTSGCCGGLDLHTIRSLPVFKYHRDVKQPQLDCAICLSEFQEGEALKVIPYCEHVFHPECIDMWLASNVTCPVCRSKKFLQMKRDDDGGLGTIDKKGDRGRGGSTSQQGSTVENRVKLKHDGQAGSHSERRTSNCFSLEGGRLVFRRTLSI
ncbi:hypothetical protein L6164_019026 [Bauhinia variegata]|uniref:Uncharacterized protein n=1 Tax=Bauhinia variegata TaxID=167791 RepID=A0ACB9ND04_BAUVA|nr:hypothetical protein L6164_019026 [Bauhinia variegata]